MRNEGLSRKAAYPLKIEMREDGKAIVVGGAAKAKLFGEWRPAGTGYVVVTQLPRSVKRTQLMKHWKLINISLNGQERILMTLFSRKLF